MRLQRHIEPDHLGSPRKVIEPSRGTALWDWPILGNAFGTAAANDDADGDGNAISLNLRFPGQQYDAATGLHYNYFRDYDPSTGRYVESDPIGLWGGINTYSYVEQNPMLLIDDEGLSGRQGERSRAGSSAGTPNQFKHMKPDPARPGNVIDSGDPSGKSRTKPAPGGFAEYWNKKHPGKPFKPRGFLDPDLPLWCVRLAAYAALIFTPGNFVDDCRCPCGEICEY